MDHFKEPFDPDAMHPAQGHYFRYPHKLRDIANDPARLADFYADVIATAHRDFRSPTDTKTQTGIRMYSASLQDLGFERTQLKDLPAHLRALRGDMAVIVVVGCQSETLLDARARAAARVFMRAVDAGPKPLAVLFSGRHPPQDKVEILNEAATLKESFETVLTDRKYQTHYNALVAAGRILIEKESENTSQNIIKLFETITTKLHSETPVKTIDLFLVSNDFHLVRISKDVRTVLKSTASVALKLASLSLVGSEFFVPENVKAALESPEYSKRFYFEALSDFFRRNQFLDDRDLLSTVKDGSTTLLGHRTSVSCFPQAPFANNGESCSIQFRLNDAVLFPLDNDTFFKKWVREYFKKPNADTERVRSRMRLLWYMGGRQTQPTFRIAGEIRADQTGLVNVTLANNFDGISHAVQLGLMSTVNRELEALLTHYNLLSVIVIASYIYEDSGKTYILFHRRAGIKYTFPSCWDCAVEGPIYKDDLRGEATLNIEAAAVRIFEKVHIESINHDVNVALSFKAHGVTFDPSANQCCIQGTLKGGTFKPQDCVRATDELVDDEQSCRATPDDVGDFIQRMGGKWNPAALYNILYTLEYLGFKEEQVKAAFVSRNINLLDVVGSMTTAV